MLKFNISLKVSWCCRSMDNRQFFKFLWRISFTLRCNAIQTSGMESEKNFARRTFEWGKCDTKHLQKIETFPEGASDVDSSCRWAKWYFWFCLHGLCFELCHKYLLLLVRLRISECTWVILILLEYVIHWILFTIHFY